MKDVIVALRNMKDGIKFFLLMVGKAVLITAFGAGFCAVVGYLLVHYLLVFLGLVFLAGLGFWFYIELENARAIRLWEEGNDIDV